MARGRDALYGQGRRSFCEHGHGPDCSHTIRAADGTVATAHFRASATRPAFNSPVSFQIDVKFLRTCRSMPSKPPQG